MTTNFQRTAAWLTACGKEQNDANLSLQLGCDLEETCEFFSTIQFKDKFDQELVTSALLDLEWLADRLKKGASTATIPEKKREEALDALCDREVTGNGVSHFAKFDKDGADQAVLASNDAKLVNGKPVILPGGKIGKPEGWTPPNLTPFI